MIEKLQGADYIDVLVSLRRRHAARQQKICTIHATVRGEMPPAVAVVVPAWATWQGGYDPRQQRMVAELMCGPCVETYVELANDGRAQAPHYIEWLDPGLDNLGIGAT